MARVLMPVMPRTYNPNPRGSATTTVRMRADMPFERPSMVVNSNRGMLPGMSGLGADPAPGTPPIFGAQGVDWTALLNQGAQIGIQAGQSAIQNAITPHMQQMSTPSINHLPVMTGARAVAPAKPIWPWVVGGVVVVGAIGALLLLRKKK